MEVNGDQQLFGDSILILGSVSVCLSVSLNLMLHMKVFLDLNMIANYTMHFSSGKIEVENMYLCVVKQMLWMTWNIYLFKLTRQHGPYNVLVLKRAV